MDNFTPMEREIYIYIYLYIYIYIMIIYDYICIYCTFINLQKVGNLAHMEETSSITSFHYQLHLSYTVVVSEVQQPRFLLAHRGSKKKDVLGASSGREMKFMITIHPYFLPTLLLYYYATCQYIILVICQSWDISWELMISLMFESHDLSYL